MSDPSLTKENIRCKSEAAAGLLCWVQNVVRYTQILKKVEELKEALEAQDEWQA